MLDTLPHHVLSDILSLLSPEDLHSCLLTCSALHEVLAENAEVWGRVARSHISDRSMHAMTLHHKLTHHIRRPAHFWRHLLMMDSAWRHSCSEDVFPTTLDRNYSQVDLLFVLGQLWRVTRLDNSLQFLRYEGDEAKLSILHPISRDCRFSFTFMSHSAVLEADDTLVLVVVTMTYGQPGLSLTWYSLSQDGSTGITKIGEIAEDTDGENLTITPTLVTWNNRLAVKASRLHRGFLFEYQLTPDLRLQRRSRHAFPEGIHTIGYSGGELYCVSNMEVQRIDPNRRRVVLKMESTSAAGSYHFLRSQDSGSALVGVNLIKQSLYFWPLEPERATTQYIHDIPRLTITALDFLQWGLKPEEEVQIICPDGTQGQYQEYLTQRVQSISRWCSSLLRRKSQAWQDIITTSFRTGCSLTTSSIHIIGVNPYSNPSMLFSIHSSAQVRSLAQPYL